MKYRICFSVAGAFGIEMSFNAEKALSYEEAAASRIGDMIKNGIFSRLIFLTNNPRTGTVKEVMKID